jgi:diphthamide synthase (EF-2-diphthine--ammonia ligase)
LLDVQSLAEREQAQTSLLCEAANTHAEATAAHEAKLQAEVAAARKIQCVKEAMACQARKEVDDLKKRLEDVERKDNSDLQAVAEGTLSSLLRADSMCFFVRSWSQVFDLESLQVLEGPRRPSR